MSVEPARRTFGDMPTLTTVREKKTYAVRLIAFRAQSLPGGSFVCIKFHTLLVGATKQEAQRFVERGVELGLKRAGIAS